MFHPTACYVKSQVSKEILLIGTLGQDGLYCFKGHQVLKKSRPSQGSQRFPRQVALNNVAVAVTDVNHSTSFSLWHGRLGHANSNTVKIVLDICKVPFRNKNSLDFCNACCLGKSHRLHAPASTHTYQTPFEVVYSDIWGPSPVVSSCGFTYYITFVDAHTRFTWIYFLKHKSEALTTFKQFYHMLQTQFSAKL